VAGDWVPETLNDYPKAGLAPGQTFDAKDTAMKLDTVTTVNIDLMKFLGLIIID